MRATFEIEATLLDGDGRPAHTGPGYSTTALALLEEFLFDLAGALEAAGIEVEQFHPEYAPGQFEVSIAPADPLLAADDLVFVRTQMRFAARRRGMAVSFAPIVFAGEVGNGCHMHLSLWRDGVNLMQGGDRPGGLTGTGAAGLGGVVAALPELLAVLAPSPLAYLRLQPHHWAGAYSCWGVENREAAVRFIPGTVTGRERSANFEVKVGDGGANPYLVVALLAAAALDGVERAAPLPDPVQDDPAALPAAERERRGIARLPQTLADATDRLEASTLARRVLGDVLHDAFVAVRRRESDTYGALSEDQAVAAYRWRY
jgi:glutamine synthetase